MNLDRMTQRDFNMILKESGENVWFYKANLTTDNMTNDKMVSTYNTKKRERVVMQYNDNRVTLGKTGLMRMPEVTMFTRKSLNPLREDVVVPTRNNISYSVEKAATRFKVIQAELMELNQ